MKKTFAARQPKAGRLFPPEFLEVLSSQLFNLAFQELREFGTPQEVIDALDSAFLMTFYERHIERGTMSDAVADEVPENIAQAITLIIELGGVLSDGKTYIDFSQKAKRESPKIMEPENQKVELTTSLISTLRGAPITIFVLLMIERKPLEMAQIRLQTGYSQNTVSDGIALLVKHGLITQTGRYSYQIKQAD